MKHIRHDAFGCLPMAALFIAVCGLAWWLASPAKAQGFTIIGTKPGSIFSCLYAGGGDWVVNETSSGGDL